MPQSGILPRYGVTAQGIDVSSKIMDCSIEENKGELATRCSLQIALPPSMDASATLNLFLAGARIELFADDTSIYPPMRVMRFRFADDKRTLTVYAYDMLINLTKSDTDQFFRIDQTAGARIQIVAAKDGIPIGEISNDVRGVVLKEKYFKNTKVAQVIMETLTQARMRSGKPGLDFFIRARKLPGSDGTLMDIMSVNSNATSYSFDDTNSVSDEDEWDIEELKTEIDVIGSRVDPLRSAVTSEPNTFPPWESVVINDTDGKRLDSKYGMMRRIVYARDIGSSDDADVANIGAQYASAEGAPRRVQSVRTMDIPTLHKGEGHRFHLGTIDSDSSQPGQPSGRRIVTGVTRNWKSGEMLMTIDSSGILGRYVVLEPAAVDPNRPVVVNTP